MNEYTQDNNINDYQNQVPQKRISPIKQYQLNEQKDNKIFQQHQEQFKPQLTLTTESEFNSNYNTLANKSNKFQNDHRMPKNAQTNSFGKQDAITTRKEFKKIKQNVNNSRQNIDQSYHDQDKEVDSSIVRFDRNFEMTKIDKSLNSSFLTNQMKDSKRLGQATKHSAQEQIRQHNLKSQQHIADLKEKKKLEKQQSMLEQSRIYYEKQNTKRQEMSERQMIQDKLESKNFYPAVNEMIDDMHITFDNFIIVKKINLLKTNTMQTDILDPLIEKNPHINMHSLNDSLFAKLTRFILNSIKIRSFIVAILEWIWIIIFIILNGVRLHHFNQSQISENAIILSDDILTGPTIPILLLMQVLLWILCNLSFIVSVLKCRLPFSTFHIMLHMGEIILNIFTFFLGLNVVYNNKNSSAVGMHFSIGIINFIISFVCIIISKSANGYFKKFLILMNQYSVEEFQNSCC